MQTFQKCPHCGGNLNSLTKVVPRNTDDYVCGRCFSRFMVVLKLVTTLHDPYGIAGKDGDDDDGDAGVQA